MIKAAAAAFNRYAGAFHRAVTVRAGLLTGIVRA
jgi:hypothetical protein